MKTPEEARKALATIRAKLAPEFAKLGLVPREHRDDSWELDGTWNTIVSIESRRTGSWSTTYRDTVLRFAGRYREPRFTARSVVLWSRERGAIDDKGIAELIALVAERVRLEKLAIEQETRNEQRQAAAKKMVAALRRELGRVVPELCINSTADFRPCVDIQIVGADPDDLKRKLRALATAILDECPKPKEPT